MDGFQIAVTPLSTIPPVYFDENFQLQNPRTFDQVSERSEVVISSRPPSDTAGDSTRKPRKPLATNAILQEKLSWYIDTVEMHLIPSLYTASDSFFTELESLQKLQSEATECVKQVQSLRDDLETLDKKVASGDLKVIKMKRRGDNLPTLHNAVEQLNRVIQGVAHCKRLVDKGHLILALDGLDLVDRIISRSLSLDGSSNLSWQSTVIPQRLIDLRELKVLDHLGDEMQQLCFRIGKEFETCFLDTLLNDLRQHIQSISPQNTLRRWGIFFQRGRDSNHRTSSGTPDYMKQTDQMRHNLEAILIGLHRSRYTTQAAAEFRLEIGKQIKDLIRQNLPFSTDEENEAQDSSTTTSNVRVMSQQNRSVHLAKNPRALHFETAEDLYFRIYTSVGEALRRLGIPVKLLLDITSGPLVSTHHQTPPMRSPSTSALPDIEEFLYPGQSPGLANQAEDGLKHAVDIFSLLGEAVDIAQAQIIKLLEVRSEQTANLPLGLFLRYFHLNLLFADECEAISERSGAALKGVVNSQIGDYIQGLGDSAKQQLTSDLDGDKWEAKDFVPDEMKILDRLLQGMILDHQDWLRPSLIWEKLEERAPSSTELKRDGKVAVKSHVRSAIIDEQSCILVESAVSALRHIDYLIVTFPGKIIQISNLLLDILKLFNSRSCQLILGAGARHSAGLKTINSKNLALASQALGFFIALIPYLREFVRRHSGNISSLSEFDMVRQLYQDHQLSIHDKLIEIMSLRSTARVSYMKKIDWDTDTQGTSPYMQAFTDETRTLYKVLNKNMPGSTVAPIMGPVMQNYKEQWGKTFDEAIVRTPRGKARLLRDVVFFGTRLDKIEGIGDIGLHLTAIVNGKQIDSL